MFEIFHNWVKHDLKFPKLVIESLQEDGNNCIRPETKEVDQHVFVELEVFLGLVKSAIIPFCQHAVESLTGHHTSALLEVGKKNFMDGHVTRKEKHFLLPCLTIHCVCVAETDRENRSRNSGKDTRHRLWGARRKRTAEETSPRNRFEN